MTVDGSLVFNTKIDTDGFEKDADKASSKFVNLKNKIANTEAEISRLTQELEEMANTPIDSGITKKLERDIEKAKIKLNELYAEADRIGDSKKADLTDMGVGTEHLDEILGRDESWLKVQSQIDSAEAKLRQYETELRKVKTAENLVTGKDTAEYRKKQQRISELNGKLEVYQVQLRETQQKENQTKNSTKKTNNALKSFSKGLNSVISRLGKTAKSFTSFAKKGVTKATSSLKKLTSSVRKSNSQMSGLGRTLNSLKGMLLSMVFFNVISGVMNSMTESMGQMSKESTSVNKKLSALQTSFKYLKNSIASAFMPILNVVTPILTNFMDLVSGVTNKIANFIAVLTGQSSYQKAVKVQQDYAESLDDTAKEAEKATNSLASFDELNVMQDNSSSTSSSTGTSTEDYFQSVPTVFDDFANKLKKAIKKGDFESIGELVANKFNKALKNIKWNKIRSTTKKWANNIVGFLNGFINKANWALVGSTFGNAINTIINTGYEFVINFDWEKFGSGIRESIVSTLETIDFNKAIDFFTGALNGLVDSVINLIGTPNFFMWGQKVYDGIVRALNKINWDNISALFTTLVVGALDFINGLTVNINWETLGEKIKTSFAEFFNPESNGREIIEKMKSTFVSIAGGALTIFDSIFKPEEWKKYGKDFAKGVETWDTGEDAIQNKVIRTLGNILNSCLNFINAFFSDQGTADKLGEGIETMLSNVPWASIIMNALSSITNIGSWLIYLATDLVETFCEGLATGFNNMEDDEELKNAVDSLFTSIGNLIITIIEGVLKIIVNAIPNFFVGLVKVILGILSSIASIFLGPDYFNSAMDTLWGENSFKVDIPVNIPRLATGTVVPASYGEFLAVLGDNKRETEVVSPLSTIKQALAEVMAEVGGASGSEEINLNVYLDGDKIFKNVVKHNNRYKKSHGKSAM